jgi:hypothetical protein
VAYLILVTLERLDGLGLPQLADVDHVIHGVAAQVEFESKFESSLPY